MNDINLEKITLDIDGKKLELTLEQCEELKKFLDKIVEKKSEFTISSPWVGGTITFPTYPYKTSDYPFPKPVISWCETTGTNNQYEVIGVYCRS